MSVQMQISSLICFGATFLSLWFASSMLRSQDAQECAETDNTVVYMDDTGQVKLMFIP